MLKRQTTEKSAAAAAKNTRPGARGEGGEQGGDETGGDA